MMEQFRRTEFRTCAAASLHPTPSLASAAECRPIPRSPGGLTRRWTVVEAGGGACDCTAQTVPIEVCTVKDADFNERCVTHLSQGAGPTDNFLAARSSL